MSWGNALKPILIFGGRKIIAKIGTLDARDRRNIGRRTYLNIFLVRGKENVESSVGMELIYRRMGYYNSSPLILSKTEMQGLIELLQKAIEG